MFLQLYVSVKTRRIIHWKWCKLCLNNPDFKKKTHPSFLLTLAHASHPWLFCSATSCHGICEVWLSCPFKSLSWLVSVHYLACWSPCLQLCVKLSRTVGRGYLHFVFPTGNSALTNSEGLWLDAEEGFQFGWTHCFLVDFPLAHVTSIPASPFSSWFICSTPPPAPPTSVPVQKWTFLTRRHAKLSITQEISWLIF